MSLKREVCINHIKSSFHKLPCTTSIKNSEIPDILLNLTPLRLSLGSLQTSISHWNWLSYIQRLTKSLIQSFWSDWTFSSPGPRSRCWDLRGRKARGISPSARNHSCLRPTPSKEKLQKIHFVSGKYLLDFCHDLIGVSATGGLHAPSEP